MWICPSKKIKINENKIFTNLNQPENKTNKFDYYYKIV